MVQRDILGNIAPDFKRDNQTQEQYIEEKKNATVEYIKDYVTGSCMGGIVLGISGGVDSFLAGALCALALKELNKTLRLVILPNGVQADYADAEQCVAQIKALYPAAIADTVSIAGGYRAALADLEGAAGFSQDTYTLANLQPRLRMMYQYALAKDLLVAGTDNAAEAITGFFTKYGDGGSDVNPLQELVKDDIYRMAKLLGAPKAVMEKSPAAGLGISEDDESELGLKYKDICAYLKGYAINAAETQTLEGIYTRSMHKRAMPASMRDLYQHTETFSLVVVDLVQDFIDGTLACQNAAQALENSLRVINKYPQSQVLYIKDCHPQNHCSFEENGGRWPVHAVEDTPGSSFPQAFYTQIKKTTNTPIAHYNVFKKGTDPKKEQYSALDAQNETFGSLKQNLAPHVVVAGAATEYCVLHTVKDLMKEGFRVTVLKNCLAYVEESTHRAALEQIAQAGAHIK